MGVVEQLWVCIRAILKWTSRSRRQPVAILSIGIFAVASLDSARADGAPAMTIPGQFSVNSVGAATYSIPITVPPGTAGMVPGISLDYSSQSGDGIVGLGWMLSGLQSIERCPRTVAQDGVHGGVNYNANDRFCLGGQRLVPANGADGGDGTIYGTEIEGFSKIISHCLSGNCTTTNGPAWFEVHTKSGQIMEFGNSTDSRALAVGTATAISWAVNKVYDAVGNYYTVTYTNDTTHGQIYPSRIDYTGNTNASVPTYNSVQFFYSTTTRVDTTPTWQAGSLKQITVLLTAIKTYAGSALVLDYELGYRPGTSTLHSRLTSLTLYDASGTKSLASTTFGWQGGTGALTATLNTTPVSQGNIKEPANFNGDGLTDIVAIPAAISQPNPACVYLGLQSGGFSAATMTVSVNGGPQSAACFNGGTLSYMAYVGDIDGDGFSDIIGLQQFFINENVSAYYGYSFINNHSGVFNRNATNAFSVGPGVPLLTGDLSGLGRTDLCSNNVTMGNGDGTFGPTSPPNANCAYFPLVADFDGDGCADAEGSNVIYFMCSPAVATAPLPTVTGSAQAVGDFNGDGKADLLFWNWSGGGTLYLSTGTGFSSPYNLSGLLALTGPVSVKAGDFNGDGKADIAVVGVGSTTIWLSTGTGFVQGPTFTYSSSGDTTVSGSIGDWNSDGASDVWVVKYSGDVEIPFDFTPELMTTISNGIGPTPTSVTTTIQYDRLNKNGTFYTKGTSSTLPERDVDGPIYEVKEVDVSNGIGGVYSKTYAYAGAVADTQGRGFLGFSSVTTTDSQTGIVETTNYGAVFPLVGLVTSRTRTGPKTGGGTVTLSTVTNTPTDTNLGAGTDGVVRHFVSVTQSVTAANDLDGTALPGSTTNYSYDAYGNQLTANTSMTDGSSKAVTNTWLNDTTNWFLGRVTSTVATNTVGSSVITRTSCFQYDPTTGLLTREVIEPISITNCVHSTIGVQTDYTYDPFAHVQTTTISGSGIQTRTKSASYDPLGQFQTQGCNFLNQCENYHYDARFGERTSLTDPNNLTTNWGYDAFGRMSLETRPDGTKTAFSYDYCSGVNGGTVTCPSPGAVREQATPENASGTQNGPQATATYDCLLRPIAGDAQGFNGALIRTATQYDVNGRFKQTSRPYFVTGGTPEWTAYTYDALGRVTGKNYPNGGSQSFTYHGPSTSVTNDLSQTTTTVKNAQGLVASVTDALLNTTSYVYDAFGNPTSVTDALGNTITNIYDVRGNKTSSTDPDLGHWTYGHDVLGELTSQIDAKSQSTTLTYNLVGQMTIRTENNLVSTWTYGTTPANYNVGKLIEAKACTTAGCTTVVSDRTFFYDPLGRPSSNTLATGGANYTYSQSYNGDGRLATTTYPSGFATLNIYNTLGYRSQIKDNGTGKLIWKATSRDAELHATAQTFGNSVAETDTYDPTTGFLTNVRAGPTDSVAAFDYNYDTQGNLRYRSDNLNGVFEYACYDALNRLQYDAAGNGVTSCTSSGYKTVAYDVLGSITSKTGVGTYHYPAPGAVLPHAVNAITGTVNGTVNPHYGYDANGNMVCEYTGGSCGGSGVVRESASWTAFNMVAQLSQGTTSVSLTYDSEHARILQHEQYASNVEDTTYVNDAASGAMEEHVVLSGTTTWRDYVLADGRIVMEKFSGATVATNYMASDHLGSIAVLTDQTGAVVERDAYDAWGKRRNLDGSDDTACALTSQTTRGFTGHEHIDDLCLIDANARLYDPTLGRFLSPDDMIPEPTDMQSLNRFSYVRNRPLSVTDPTGHDDGCEVDECTSGDASRWSGGDDTEGGFLTITDGMGDTLPGLISWGSSAAGTPDATAGAAACSGPTGGSKSQNDQRNREHYWKVTHAHQNSDGTWTIAYAYVQGYIDSDGYLDVTDVYGTPTVETWHNNDELDTSFNSGVGNFQTNVPSDVTKIRAYKPSGLSVAEGKIWNESFDGPTTGSWLFDQLLGIGWHEHALVGYYNDKTRDYEYKFYKGAFNTVTAPLTAMEGYRIFIVEHTHPYSWNDMLPFSFTRGPSPADWSYAQRFGDQIPYFAIHENNPDGTNETVFYGGH